MRSSLGLYGIQSALYGAKKSEIREFEDKTIAFVAMVVQGERTKTAVAKLSNGHELLRRASIFESFVLVEAREFHGPGCNFVTTFAIFLLRQNPST